MNISKKNSSNQSHNQNIPALPSLGVRLRHARLVCGLTLKQLASQADCSESLISKLEHEAASPSLAMLHRLANALNTNISELTAEHWGNEEPVLRAGCRLRTRFDKNSKAGDIELERLVLTYKGGLLQANIHILAPGAASDGLIVHVGEELGFVLEGFIELTIEDKQYQLKTGDSFHFASNKPHGYSNLGNSEARILWINTPATF